MVPQALVPLRGHLPAPAYVELAYRPLSGRIARSLLVLIGCWGAIPLIAWVPPHYPWIVLAFATADPEVAVFSPQGPWFLAGSGVAVILLLVHLRVAADPIVPRGALRATLNSFLTTMVAGEMLVSYELDVTAGRSGHGRRPDARPARPG